jgi:hypothetical protein
LRDQQTALPGFESGTVHLQSTNYSAAGQHGKYDTVD